MAVQLRRFSSQYAIFLVIVALGVFLSVQSDVFLTGRNLANVSEQISMVGMIAMGMTMLLISGNFDLSIGGMVALVGIVMAQVANHEGLAAGIVLAVPLGAALGAVNGLIVTKVKVNSLVATLGSGLAFSGVAYALSGSAPVVISNPSLQNFVSVRIHGVPKAAIFLVAVVLFASWLLHLTAGGRQMFAVGANSEAARYAGVRVDLVRFLPFCITGVFCGLSAIILTGLLSTALPQAADTWPLDVIAAVVVGGVSIAGGRGSTIRGLAGVLLIGLVGNGFNLLNVNPAYQQVFTGTIIVLAVAIDTFGQRRGSGPVRLRRPTGSATPSTAPSQPIEAAAASGLRTDAP
jgi:ribose/xylose/arabinose/galactoside ABC-type transport system permease subunit